MSKWLIPLVSLIVGFTLGMAYSIYLGTSSTVTMPLPTPGEGVEPQPEEEDLIIVEDAEHGPTAKANLIQVDSVLPGDTVSSPLTVIGEARGYWFFEASFPVKVLDANNQQLAVAVAQAQGEWMTEDFVPFSVTLTYPMPTTPTGTIVFEKDNPSGLPEHDDYMTIPVVFYE